MKHVVLAAVLASVLLGGCYSIRTSAPPGTAATFASSAEPCAPVMSRRVHYALAGLVHINSNEITVPGNARVRVVTEADAVDIFLRAVGAVFTFGLYGGTQSATVEMCQPGAGAPFAGPIVMPHAEPAVTIPLVIEAGGSNQATGVPSRKPVQPTECKLNSNGSHSCGYNCRLGSDGYHYCSSVPNGECSLNGDGSWSCP